ncbi:MAG: ABC transporter ATP-binding protein [Desulfovibrionaceae bacterium]|nr:ABC transporter ATP-binding protein [Desulfovibrionaceae bacterium]
MEPVLRVSDLEVSYHTQSGTLAAVRNAGFQINPAEIVGIVGESGSGKSTLALALMRLLPQEAEITSGEMVLKGRDLRGLQEEQMRRIRSAEMAMVFQDSMTSLNPVFSIGEQMMDVALAHRVHGIGRIGGRKEAKDQVIAMLDRVGIPSAARRFSDFPHQFSGGMRQRIMIATALLSGPSLLIADEPTSALDVVLEAQINDLILALRDESRMAVLYITHNLGVAAQVCDRMLVMYAGNIVEAGEVRQIFKEPLHPYTKALLGAHPKHVVRRARVSAVNGLVPDLKAAPAGCRFAVWCEASQTLCLEREPKLHHICGRDVLCHLYDPSWRKDTAFPQPLARYDGESANVRRQPKEPLVSIRNVSTYFNNSSGLLSRILGKPSAVVRAVDGVSLDVRRGETLALVGESGSGKTTLGRTILRLEDPTDGEIIIEGKDITRMAQSKIRPMRKIMQMIFQDPISSLSPRKIVSELLLEPFTIHGIAVDGPAKAREMLEMVGLSPAQLEKYPHQLSGGQARRVGIARSLALNPHLLIADEPTAGLDVSVAAGILNLLKDLRDRLSLTYIIITHNLDITSAVADQVAVMYLGRIVEMADGAALFDHSRHPYTKALLSSVAIPDPEERNHRQRIILEGEVPSPTNVPSGCPFHPRCRYRQARCSSETPSLSHVAGDASRLVACHFPL